MSKLSKHQITRSFMAPKANSADDFDQNQSQLRENLEWQCRVADVLHGYTVLVANAFGSLMNALQQLDDVNIGDAGSAGTMAKALINGLKEAQDKTSEMAASMRLPLETHRAIIAACFDDLTQADNAAAEAKRYNLKLESLSDEAVDRNDRGHSSAKAQARLARNRDKLNNALKEAAVRQTRVQDSLLACMSRKDKLCELTLEAVQGTVEALSCGLTYVKKPGAASVAKGFNPFEDEVTHPSSRQPVVAAPAEWQSGRPHRPSDDARQEPDPDAASDVEVSPQLDAHAAAANRPRHGGDGARPKSPGPCPDASVRSRNPFDDDYLPMDAAEHHFAKGDSDPGMDGSSDSTRCASKEEEAAAQSSHWWSSLCCNCQEGPVCVEEVRSVQRGDSSSRVIA